MFGINLNDSAVVSCENSVNFKLPATWAFVAHTGISKVKLVKGLSVTAERFVAPVRFDKKERCFVRNLLGEVLKVPMSEELFYQTGKDGLFTAINVTNGNIEFKAQLFAKQEGNKLNWKLEGDTLLLNEDIIHLNVILEMDGRQYKFWYNKPEETK